MSAVRLIDWTILGNFVSLIYSDCSSFLIKKEDFHRSFLTILSFPRDVIKRDFAVLL